VAFEETEEWRQGVAALDALRAFDAHDLTLQNLLVSVRIELTEGFLRLARAMRDQRQWNQVRLFCDQSLTLTPGQYEALQMRAGSEEALLLGRKSRT